ncbi:MAG TPA: energy transducer TonB [Terriglobia bacterium]|nr:energy transducer TonB [Terriglobia bacterium]
MYYDLDGNLLKGGSRGAWTLYAYIDVEHVKLRGAKLEIDGTRNYLVYNQEAKRFERRRGSRVKIEAAINPNAVGSYALQILMRKLFLAPNEDLADYVPPYWKRFLTHADRPGTASQQDELLNGERIYRIKGQAGDVNPPIPIHTPEPRYTEAARDARYQAVAVFWITVDPQGDVAEVNLVKPVGLGLDDQAAATLKTWKFKPATKNGKPVPVRVMVETSFRLR